MLTILFLFLEQKRMQTSSFLLSIHCTQLRNLPWKRSQSNTLFSRRESWQIEKQFQTSVHRKPTFTGRYMRWDSFAPSKRKTNQIETLVHQALVICSPGKVKQELDCIRSILKNNSYPEIIINSSISKKISRFQLLPEEGPKKFPAYLKLPWIGNTSRKFEKQVKSNVQNCFRAVDSRVIFQTRKILPSIYKDAVPITHQSMVAYQYVCRCDCRYVGRTSLRLQDRINQHIPKSIRNKENPTK